MIDSIFFILHEPRSGSTYLSNLLSRSPDICIPPESNFIPFICKSYSKNAIENSRDAEKLSKIINREEKFADWNISESEISESIGSTFPVPLSEVITNICDLYREKNQQAASIFGIKKGNCMWHYSRLKEIFPEAVFIELIRDGRAVFSSKKRAIGTRSGKPFETSPRRAAKLWAKTMRLFKEIRTKHPETILVKYEELITSAESTVADILKALSAAPMSEEHINNSYAVPERYGDELHKNINMAPQESRIDAWKSDLSKEEILVFESRAKRDILNNNYELFSSNADLNNSLLCFSASIKHLIQRS